MAETARRYDILLEPAGTTYAALLDHAVTGAAIGLVVVRELEGLTDDARDTLNVLNPWLIECREDREWPGTRLFGGQRATLYYFRLGPEVADVLKGRTRSLYEWVEPDRPEDLCLLRDDRSPWLASIAHERDAYLELTDHEHRTLIAAVPGVELGPPGPIN